MTIQTKNNYVHWQVIDTTNAEYIGIIELESGEYFEVVKTENHLVFGNSTNIGLLESGNYLIDACFSLDENLQELIADLESYYIDGAGYQSDNFSCNDRM